MANTLEDFFGKLLGIGLLIAGIGWLIQWVCRKIVDNAGPILIVVGVIAAFAIVGMIINKRNEAKAAVARWEQTDLVPLLSSLNAMEKLNRSESIVASLPREMEVAESRIPDLERRFLETDSRARSLNACLT